MDLKHENTAMKDNHNFYAGAARIDITPPLGTILDVDYVPHYARFIHDPLYVKALVFRDEYLTIALNQNIVLEAGSEKIKELDMLKTRFFINISHEFRTPLTLILGPIESMITDFKKNEWMESASKLELINRNAKRLLNLVNQLIDIHKIGSGSMRLKVSHTNIGVFVNEIADLFKQLAIERDIIFLLPINTNPIEVYIDVEKMEKVIFNLLSNAFKYNKPNGNIEINIEENQTNVTIQISDTGNGINKESLPYVFEHFYQAFNAQSTIEESSGIGLSLCKSLVELHHGTIDVQSIENEGSTFIVTLPLGKSHFKSEEIIEITNDQLSITNDQLQIANWPQMMNNQQLTTLLIVDDNADMRAYIKSELIGEYQIIEAVNGAEGFEKALEHNPELIISDVMMPVTDGIEFCNNIKTNELTSHLPVILLTARNTEKSAIEGFAIGADDYITKPFSAAVLKSRIKNILQTRAMLRQIYSREIKIEPKAITLNPTDEKFMAKALAIVEKNIDNPEFSVVQLADEMIMSRTNLLRKIKVITGDHVSDFINSMRMKKAAQLLLETDLSVSEIANMVGFNYANYFGKCFQKTFGKTPSQYRSN